MADLGKLEPYEQKNMLYYAERVGRVTAQLSNIKLQEGMLRQELELAQSEFTAAKAELITKYKLSPEDSINLQTGKMQRKETP